ncbi:hypothetical protein [Streptomyces sp. enrichment culture]
MWLFGEAASLAQVEWRRACLPPPEEGTLFNAGDTFDDEEEQRARAWVERIRKNLEYLQQQLGTFTIDDHQSEILAGVLGQARNKHIRAAVKQLHKDGKTSCNGIGDVRKLRVTPPPQRRQP